jgi:hypothetical protein
LKRALNAWEDFGVGLDAPKDEPFVKVIESLGELEVTIGEKARPFIAEVRADLSDAMAKREAGDMPAALMLIRRAMERLAALGGQLDPNEGAAMRIMAQRFSQALSLGDKDTAKGTVNFMRHKAGDPHDDKDSDW